MRSTDYIFGRHNGQSMVNSDIVTSIMKWGTRRLGLNDSKVSAHSLRYGGATMLAAAGLPHYLIAWYGGWTEDSSTMRMYATLGNEAISLVSSTMCRQGETDLCDIKVRQKIQSLRSSQFKN
jgi:integrase